MSALPHKADIDARDCDVRFVPTGDIPRLFLDMKEVANGGDLGLGRGGVDMGFDASKMLPLPR
jgi:hypothetical protein